ncbi:unnamed protein product, partial [Closterium sp. Naga37s-1]
MACTKNACPKEEYSCEEGEKGFESEEEAEDSEEEADDVRRESEEEADDVRRESKEEADDVRRESEEEADDVRRESEEEADDVRRESEEEADDVRRESEEEAEDSEEEADDVRRESEEEAEDVRREVEVLEAVRGHPCSVQLQGVFEDEEHVHLVMDLCQGGDLWQRVQQRGAYSEAEAAAVVGRLVGLLRDLHALGIMHRDVKPENVLLRREDDDVDVAVIDYGVSVFFNPGERFSEIVGSPFYIAPEVLHESYGPESDIWAAGVILFVLLSGVLPFWGDSDEGVFRAILEKSVEEEMEREGVWESVSDEAKDLVMRMLSKDAALRITADEILVLCGILKAEIRTQISTASPVSPAPHPPSSPSPLSPCSLPLFTPPFCGPICFPPFCPPFLPPFPPPSPTPFSLFFPLPLSDATHYSKQQVPQRSSMKQKEGGGANELENVSEATHYSKQQVPQRSAVRRVEGGGAYELENVCIHARFKGGVTLHGVEDVPANSDGLPLCNEAGCFTFPVTYSSDKLPRGKRGHSGWIEDATAVIMPLTAGNPWHFLHHVIPLSHLLSSQRHALRNSTVHLFPCLARGVEGMLAHASHIHGSDATGMGHGSDATHITAAGISVPPPDYYSTRHFPWWPLLTATAPPGVTLYQVCVATRMPFTPINLHAPLLRTSLLLASLCLLLIATPLATSPGGRCSLLLPLRVSLSTRFFVWLFFPFNLFLLFHSLYLSFFPSTPFPPLPFLVSCPFPCFPALSLNPLLSLVPPIFPILHLPPLSLHSASSPLPHSSFPSSFPPCPPSLPTLSPTLGDKRRQALALAGITEDRGAPLSCRSLHPSTPLPIFHPPFHSPFHPPPPVHSISESKPHDLPHSTLSSLPSATSAPLSTSASLLPTRPPPRSTRPLMGIIARDRMRRLCHLPDLVRAAESAGFEVRVLQFEKFDVWQQIREAHQLDVLAGSH